MIAKGIGRFSIKSGAGVVALRERILDEFLVQVFYHCPSLFYFWCGCLEM